MGIGTQNTKVGFEVGGDALYIKTGGKINYESNTLYGTTQVTVTSAQLLALNATPITVLAAQGAGKAIIPIGVTLYKQAGTAYVVVAGADLAFKYTNGSGAEATARVETVGMLDQTTAQTRYVQLSSAFGAVGDIAPVANAPLVVHNISATEFTTGTGSLLIRLEYKVVDTALS